MKQIQHPLSRHNSYSFPPFESSWKRKLFPARSFERNHCFFHCDKPGLFEGEWRTVLFKPPLTCFFLWSLNQCGTTNTQEPTKETIILRVFVSGSTWLPLIHPTHTKCVMKRAHSPSLFYWLWKGGGGVREEESTEPADMRRVHSLRGMQPFWTMYLFDLVLKKLPLCEFKYSGMG